MIFLFLRLGSDKFHTPVNSLLIYSFVNLGLNSLDMKREEKEFGPKVRLIMNPLQQRPVVCLFFKVVTNILVNFLGLFANNYTLRISILLLILMR
jgi:hypothetical protein